MSIIEKQYLLFNDYNKKVIDYLETNKIMVYSKFSLTDTINENINLENITWVFDENNIRIPFNSNKLNIYGNINPINLSNYKLNDTDNIYDFISSNLFIDFSLLISGERLQKLADIVVGNPSSLQWNPNNLFFSKAMISIQELNDLRPYEKIFVFTHDLEDFYRKFEHDLSDKIIISHNSDHEIKQVKNVKLHLAQNCLMKQYNLIPLPIGIENNQWFDYNILEEVRDMNIKKSKHIYFYFNMNTHPSRQLCYTKLINKLEWNQSRPKKEYYIELSKHKYCICPRGNGLDTHRIWECLYLNVIPIIVDDIKIDNLPIIKLNDWSEIDNIKSSFTNIKMSKLTLHHYKNLI